MKKLDEYINEGLLNTTGADALKIEDEVLRYWDMLATVITFPRSGSNDDRISFYKNFNVLFKKYLKNGRDISTFDPKKDLLIGVQNIGYEESKPHYHILMFKKNDPDTYVAFGTWQKRFGWKIETTHDVYKYNEEDLSRYTDKSKWILNREYFPVDIKSLGWKWEKLWKEGLRNIRY